jgi:hypothetical protein
MRALRRVPVELLTTVAGKSRTHQHQLQSGDWRASFGGELKVCEFRLSHKCVRRMMRLFVVAMEKNRKMQIIGTNAFSLTDSPNEKP